MFWDKKSARGLPDLPPAPLTPAVQHHSTETHDEEDDDDSEGSQQRHGLPSFPDSPIQKGFSQTAIKEAVSNESTESESIPALPNNEGKFKAVEIDEWSPSSTHESSFPELHTAQSLPQSIIPSVPNQSNYTPIPPKPTHSQKSGDVFVKIDKFYTAKRSLEAAENKLEEISSLLNKIRDVKMREEQELTGWEKDVTTLKARMKDITSAIFDKVD